MKVRHSWKSLEQVALRGVCATILLVGITSVVLLSSWGCTRDNKGNVVIGNPAATAQREQDVVALEAKIKTILPQLEQYLQQQVVGIRAADLGPQRSAQQILKRDSAGRRVPENKAARTDPVGNLMKDIESSESVAGWFLILSHYELLTGGMMARVRDDKVLYDRRGEVFTASAVARKAHETLTTVIATARRDGQTTALEQQFISSAKASITAWSKLVLAITNLNQALSKAESDKSKN